MTEFGEGEEKREWSAWEAWLHPRQAVWTIDNMTITEGTLLRELEEARRELDTERQTARKASDRAEKLGNELAEARRETAALKEEIKRMHSELRDQEEMVRMVEEFDKSLTRIEGMKRDYERRISDLESRLGDARARIERRDACELLDQAEDQDETGADGRRPRVFSLETRPESDAKEKNTARRSFGARPADDEWLMELPSDL